MENFELLSEIIVSDNEVDITALESSKTIDGLFIEENLEKREDTFFVDDDLRQLESLLNDFNLLQLLPILQAANVTYRCLQYIQKEDLIEAIPHLGLRVEFRENLFMWRKKGFGIDDDAISNPNKVVDWLNKDYSNVPSPSSSNSSVKRVLNKDLKTILNCTSKGQSCLEVYKQCKKLSDNNRDDIINIVIEEIICNKISLKPKDFSGIVSDICQVFSGEAVAKEYYYIERQGKKNPSGKLYSKYVNARCKRAKKSDEFSERLQCDEVHNQDAEIDDTISVALITSLNRESSNWQDVCEKWKNTYKLRQKDLKRLSNVNFLTNWPKYSDSRAPQLIEIDFNLMSAEKGHMLFSKWDDFKEKIKIHILQTQHS